MKTRCPQCDKAIEYSIDNPWRPFCSERCRLIDLGEWMEGENRIPGDEDTLLPDSSDPEFTRH